jgi:hypothetical protein
MFPVLLPIPQIYPCQFLIPDNQQILGILFFSGFSENAYFLKVADYG